MRPLSSGIPSAGVPLFSPPAEETSPAEFRRPENLNSLHTEQNRYLSADSCAALGEKPRQTLQGRLSVLSSFGQEYLGFKDRARFSVDGTATNPPCVPQTPLRRRGESTSCPADETELHPPQLKFIGWQPVVCQPMTASGWSKNAFRTPRLNKDNAPLSGMPKVDVPRLGRSQLAAGKLKRRSLASIHTLNPENTPPGSVKTDRDGMELDDPTWLPLHKLHVGPRQSSLGDDASRGDYTEKQTARNNIPRELDGYSLDQDAPMRRCGAELDKASGSRGESHPLQVFSGNMMTKGRFSDRRRSCDRLGVSREEQSLRKRTDMRQDKARRVLPLGPRPDPSRQPVGAASCSIPTRSSGCSVKAMIAIFEDASKCPTSDSFTGHVVSNFGLKPTTNNASQAIPSPSPHKTSRLAAPTQNDQRIWLLTTHGHRSGGSKEHGEVTRPSIPISPRSAKSVNLLPTERPRDPKSPDINGFSPHGSTSCIIREDASPESVSYHASCRSRAHNRLLYPNSRCPTRTSTLKSPQESQLGVQQPTDSRDNYP
ncbi:hypothetical protein L209DRAFT_43062 [Thermothelomyces heterothallicus CBS 203.75]